MGRSHHHFKQALQKIKIKDRLTQLKRLEDMVTTKTYTMLQDYTKPLQPPEYITINPSNNRAIAIIFSLRSGNPQLNENLKIRHQSENDKCH